MIVVMVELHVDAVLVAGTESPDRDRLRAVRPQLRTSSSATVRQRPFERRCRVKYTTSLAWFGLTFMAYPGNRTGLEQVVRAGLAVAPDELRDDLGRHADDHNARVGEDGPVASVSNGIGGVHLRGRRERQVPIAVDLSLRDHGLGSAHRPREDLHGMVRHVLEGPEMHVQLHAAPDHDPSLRRYSREPGLNRLGGKLPDPRPARHAVPDEQAVSIQSRCKAG